MQTRGSKLYSNHMMLDPEGQLLFRCSDRKLQWYLDRNLAVEEAMHSNGKCCARLLFKPNGSGRQGAGDAWYREPQEDRCVVCGHAADKSGLVLLHIVPAQYRNRMPLAYKSHGNHDVLPFCTSCTCLYERHALALRRQLETQYDAPSEGFGVQKQQDNASVRSATSALLRNHVGIPLERRHVMMRQVAGHFGIAPETITRDMLEEAKRLPLAIKTEGYIDHGTLVVHAILRVEGEPGLQAFVRRWRSLFIESMKPRYLSPSWRVQDAITTE
jgi:hypothetical protein